MGSYCLMDRVSVWGEEELKKWMEVMVIKHGECI